MSDAITTPVTNIDLPAPTISKSDREYRAFLRLLPELLPRYRGKYVAVHDEQVVDSDQDDVALILRVRARYGYVPLFVGLVTDEPRPAIRIPHYRLHQSEGEK